MGSTAPFATVKSAPLFVGHEVRLGIEAHRNLVCLIEPDYPNRGSKINNFFEFGYINIATATPFKGRTNTKE